MCSIVHLIIVLMWHMGQAHIERHVFIENGIINILLQLLLSHM